MDASAVLWTSLTVATCCVLGSAAPAIACGWYLARHNFPGKTLLSAITLSPLVLPPVVTGYLLLELLGRRSVIGGFFSETLGIPLSFSQPAAILAAAVVSFPLFVATARVAFEGVDERLAEMARVHGASGARIFREITLPLALPGVLAGGLLVFARALGEFGATAVVAGNIPGETRTIAIAIYTLLEDPNGDGTVALLTGISLGISLIAISGYEALLRRQRKRSEVGARPC